MPEISVLIPTFNRAEMLRKAISSVLAQTNVDIEVVVSDNCSTDNTKEVVEEFSGDARLRYSCNSSNLGMVGNWRRAIYELAESEWFLLMSDDDYLTDSRYLHQAACAIKEFQPAFVYAGGVVEDTVAGTAQKVQLPFRGLVSGDKVFSSRGTIKPQDAILCNMVFRRSDALRLGFLSNPDNLSCDSELYLKLCAEGSVYSVPDPVCVYLKHGANLVDKIGVTRKFLDGNIDYLIGSYAYAKQMGMDQAAIDAFRKNADVDRSLSSTLLRLWLHDPNWYSACRARMASLDEDLLRSVESSIGYGFKRSVLSLWKSYFRRRYPLID